ncbi:hypothetical protein CVT24_004065 [Panaeolus cyanescens]|uniref:DUF218 domain-containing protein n=1 Tax=Panaeolus cyanescens TaxID=181874 RepID=A0A409Y5T9_9AGAR|nr:hypothetical protein CVT24_004065 [Panaeolus cyanescens]
MADLLTNGGGVGETERAQKLSHQLGRPISPNQYIQAHTILKSYAHEYHDKPVLVLGGKLDVVRKVAKQYGYQKAFTTLDVLAWNPSVWPFHTLSEREREAVEVVDFSQTPISAIFVYHDPRNWALDVQVACDVLQSGGIIGGPTVKLPLQDNPVKLFFCNPDLIWRSDFDQPRIGQGAFKVAFQAVYKALTGEEYPYVQYGKPTIETYKFAKHAIHDQVQHMYNGQSEPPNVYMVGDNPESDIAGANAASWQSILVKTGVYDVNNGPPTHSPSHLADDVEGAVEWAIRQEFHKHRADSLTQRSRITNLGLYLLVTISAISLFLNFSHWSSIGSSGNGKKYEPTLLRAFSRPYTRRKLSHLIMVPCHSIWKGKDSWLNDADWLLESYQQKDESRLRAFYQHIEKGAEIANNDSESLLIFSGGQTKPASTDTEGESYLRLAHAAELFRGQVPFDRATSENFALDSYQNLLFSIARFHEYTGRYPERVTVVGYEFKRARFEKLHRQALRWPHKHFKYIGIDPEVTADSSSNHIKGELQNGYIPYSRDIYGCHTVLADKRRIRNPWSRFHPYYTSSPDLAALMDWCPGEAQGGATALFNGPLPWDSPAIVRDS